jgi:uncharacterized protein YjiS (DUF1127 family)
MYRLMSCAAASLLAFGVSVANRFLRWRCYRRILNELETLSESELRELRISKADFNTIAVDEAERRDRLKRRCGSEVSGKGA